MNEIFLGSMKGSVAEQIGKLKENEVPMRMFAKDPTLWTEDPGGQKEIRIRLDWLTLPETSRLALDEIEAFAAEVHDSGIERLLLMGMGGSSLAPEVMSQVLSSELKLPFEIIDSTDPGQVAQAARDFPPEKSLYIVSSKSGGTTETLALFQYFWELSAGDGSRFVAIADAGTSLEQMARDRNFRKMFKANPFVGGRFSALTHFGLVPASLMGLDLDRFLRAAGDMASHCSVGTPVDDNPGLKLGAVIAQAAIEGRDKLTILADTGLESMGSWLEQLIAESSGKEGKGILPIDLEPVGKIRLYGEDRLFVYLRKDGSLDPDISGLKDAGFPVLVYQFNDPYDLFAEMYRWEYATAVACHILGVNAFDQPNVQQSKSITKAKIDAYKQTGTLDEGQPILVRNEIKLFSPGMINGAGLGSSMKAFLSQAESGDYVAINAYLPRNIQMSSVLQELRVIIRELTGCAVTVGFGPRFQHSTGQYHKGGPNTGVFLQITATPELDFPIPEETLSFGMLELAQALGDYEALVANNRRVLRVHLPSPDTVSDLVKALS
ncbi:MAG: hypothetical protein JXA13_00400 [Anaerolineales bacterium]|nr:hypothetical protein [Anaerolineales bacterium]